MATADGAPGSPGSAARAAELLRSHSRLGAVRPRLLPASMAARGAGRGGGDRCGPVALRFDRPVVRGFLRCAARGDGGGGPGAHPPPRAGWLGAGGLSGAEARLGALAGGTAAFRWSGGGGCASVWGDRR